MTLRLVAERTDLRRFEPGDVADLAEIVSHPSVARALPEIEPTETGARSYIEKQRAMEPFALDKCFDLAIVRRVDGRVVGLVSLVHRKYAIAEIGWALGIAHQGLGYATEAAGALVAYAFDVLELHRIQASASSDNPRSWRVMERLGMVREGCLRGAVFKDDRRFDELIYGLLAAEWKAGRGPDST